MTRVTVVLGGLTIFAGTVATGAGPHSGGFTGQHIHRLTFKGPKTLEWAVNQHATVGVLFGVLLIATWVVKIRKRGSIDVFDPLTILGVALAGQGLLGEVQYELKLPAGMVWLHVGLATTLWLLALWAWADAAGPCAVRTPWARRSLHASRARASSKSSACLADRIGRRRVEYRRRTSTAPGDPSGRGHPEHPGRRRRIRPARNADPLVLT